MLHRYLYGFMRLIHGGPMQTSANHRTVETKMPSKAKPSTSFLLLSYPWLSSVADIIKKISTDGCTLCLAREEENDVPAPKGNLNSRILEVQKSGVRLLVTIQSVMGEEVADNVEIE